MTQRNLEFAGIEFVTPLGRTLAKPMSGKHQSPSKRADAGGHNPPGEIVRKGGHGGVDERLVFPRDRSANASVGFCWSWVG